MTLQEKLKQFVETDYRAIATEDEANAAIKFLTELHGAVGKAIENTIAPIAVKFQINAYLGEYGRDGREVVINDEVASMGYNERDIGEWMYSSETC